MLGFDFRKFLATPFILFGSIILSTGLIIRFGIKKTNKIYDGIAVEIRKNK